MTSTILFALCLGTLPTETPAGIFSPAEADRVVAFWNAPGRQTTSDLEPSAPFKVMFSPQASAWLHEMYTKRDPGQRLIPTKLPTPRTQRDKDWDSWIDQQHGQDYAWATALAAWMNQGLAQSTSDAPVSRTELPTPADLQATAGTPPPFFIVHRAQKIVVSFDDYVASYDEGVDVPRKYPFLRSAIGTVSSSSAPGTGTLNMLFQQAKLPAVLQKPVSAVASLEGGFESINTYDTGGVSLGIIQFASLSTGRGSLARLLQEFKNRAPGEFFTHFRQFGVDVAADGRLSVVDPRTGFEQSGRDAVRSIIEDKRLTAVFQRAANKSRTFQSEQLRLLAQSYNPLNLSVPVTLGGRATVVSLKQIIRSEAGIATLMDRLVNRGNLDPISSVISAVASEYGITNTAGLIDVEKEIVDRMTYRHDFLAMLSLSQPAEPKTALLAQQSSHPSITGSLGSARSNSSISHDGQVAPADPSKFGTFNPQGSAPKPEKPAGTEPAVHKDPTPKTNAGPITIPGG